MHVLWKACEHGVLLMVSISSNFTRQMAHSVSDELGLVSPSFFSFLMYFSSGINLEKWLKSLIILELIPKLLEILIPKILLLIMKIMIPTIMKAARVVSENKMLNTTNSTMKGYTLKLRLIDFDKYKSSFYFNFEGDFDLNSPIDLIVYFFIASSSLISIDRFFWVYTVKGTGWYVGMFFLSVELMESVSLSLLP